MAQRIVYKNGEEFICQHMRQVNEMLDQGWSTTPQSKKTAKPKKAKIKAEAELTGSKFDDPDNHDYSETINVDFGKIDEEK
tara:strand:- start:546 stop:788 length:243 start_codon:yes stop_codon:yes gene_type:complete